MKSEDLSPYLAETEFLDFSSPAVSDFIDKAGVAMPAYPSVREVQPSEKAQSGGGLSSLTGIYRAVRDDIHYSPYRIPLDPSYYRASRIARMTRTYCIPKAILFVACARRLGVPARLGYADVVNHLSTQRFVEYLSTDVFAFHGYAELWTGQRWLKATPVFDRALCAKMGVPVLEFDGIQDSLFQAFDGSGREFMRYVKERGVYADFPFDYVMRGFREAYPHLFAQSPPLRR